MDINAAADAIDKFLHGYTGPGGRKPLEIRVLPSGDQHDEIKVWVNLGHAAERDDLAAWCTTCEAAIRTALPATGGFGLRLRASAM